MDNLTPERRSENMRRIKGQNTGPERLVRSLLHKLGFRFRLHRRDLPGVPDIVLPKFRTVIFVHGCFWHRHKGCPDATLPKSNSAFWANKLESNRLRDVANRRKLKSAGQNVLVVWECELSDVKALNLRLKESLLAHNKLSRTKKAQARDGTRILPRSRSVRGMRRHESRLSPRRVPDNRSRRNRQ